MPLALLGVQPEALVRHVKVLALELLLSEISIMSGIALVLVKHVRGRLRVVLAPHEQPGLAGVVDNVSLYPLSGSVDILSEPLAA